MKKYRGYLSYKESGEEWLGKIPSHWKVNRLKYLAKKKLEYGANESGESDDPTMPRFIRITDINENGTLRLDSFKSISEEVAKLYQLEEGDILFARSGATVGKTIKYRAEWGKACFAGYLILCRPKTECVLPEFLYLFTLSSAYEKWKQCINIQSTIQNISAEKYNNLRLPIPPLPEQRAIADFLDRETARIDALITKYQRLMELLEEKRTSLISQAVTKGLDPSVEMKDSGVEWLGQIPEHWSANRLKYYVKLPEMKLPEKPIGAIYLGLENIESWSGRLLLDESLEDVESSVNIFKSGNVLFGKLRPYLAKVALPDFDGVSTTEILTLSPQEKLEAKFLFYVMLSEGFIKIVDSMTYGTKMPRANSEQVGSMIIPIPPPSEQRTIADFLDRETVRIDLMKERIVSMITKLKEYRTALISSAVTGKIDVRD